jgi:hypothetical protein
MKTDPDMRRRLREYYRQCAAMKATYQRACKRYMANPGAVPSPAYPSYPPYPDDLRGLPCGAKTRRGTPCKRTDLGVSGRCKFHGGMSTGPTSSGGKARALANLSRRWPVRTPCEVEKS